MSKKSLLTLHMNNKLRNIKLKHHSFNNYFSIEKYWDFFVSGTLFHETDPQRCFKEELNNRKNYWTARRRI